MAALVLNADAFTTAFGRAPFAVRHTLTDHPLLTVDAVASLADRLPERRIEQNLGDLPLVVPTGAAPRAALSPGDIARTIDSNGCWMVLKNIETDPAYRELLDRTLDEVAPYLGRREGGMGRREGFIFLSAPNSVTPVHFDPEHNFLLQVRGTKQMSVGRFDDAASEQRELERYYQGGHRNLDTVPRDSTQFALTPGDGVYVPVHAPHWVTNGPTVSVSLSITFYTRATDRLARVHVCNGFLRRRGLSPRPPGSNPVIDRTKEALTRAARVLRRLG